MTDETQAAAPEAKPDGETPAIPEQGEAVRTSTERLPAGTLMGDVVAADKPTMEDRAHALVASYERGMETNSPRTMAELNELRALLLG
jgi:hypothetical protein